MSCNCRHCGWQCECSPHHMDWSKWWLWECRLRIGGLKLLRLLLLMMRKRRQWLNSHSRRSERTLRMWIELLMMQLVQHVRLNADKWWRSRWRLLELLWWWQRRRWWRKLVESWIWKLLMRRQRRSDSGRSNRSHHEDVVCSLKIMVK